MSMLLGARCWSRAAICLQRERKGCPFSLKWHVILAPKHTQFWTLASYVLLDVDVGMGQSFPLITQRRKQRQDALTGQIKGKSLRHVRMLYIQYTNQ